MTLETRSTKFDCFAGTRCGDEDARAGAELGSDRAALPRDLGMSSYLTASRATDTNLFSVLVAELNAA